MKHIKLYEDYAPIRQFTNPENKFQPQIADHNFIDMVELLRGQGFKNIYYGQKKDGTKFISGFGKDETGRTPAIFLRDHDDHVYHFKTNDGLKASYVVGSKNVNKLVDIIRLITVTKPE